MAAIELRGLSKAYADQVVVRDIDLDVVEGEFLVLVGPSGCGKSTTLRLIAGLEDCDGGVISIDGARVNDVEPKDRDVAMVFQDYALYPHLTVYQNLSFSLRYRKVPAAEIHDRVVSVADTLGIADYLQRKPRQLSGGQRQRVAIGRCLVRQPKVFLFDEPLSNLDANLRVTMRGEIRQLHRNTRATIVYVTHDQTEAMTLADRIVVMKDGRIMQQGPPRDVYQWPASKFVAGFIGSPAMNFVPATLQSVAGGLSALVNESTAIRLSDDDAQRLNGRDGQGVQLGIRHADLKWCGENEADFVATVVDIETLGSETLVYFVIAGSTLVCCSDADRRVSVGEKVTLRAEESRLHVFDEVEGQRL